MLPYRTQEEYVRSLKRLPAKQSASTEECLEANVTGTSWQTRQNRSSSRRIKQYQTRYTHNSGIFCLPSFHISIYYCFDFIPFIGTVEMGVTLLEGAYSHQLQDSLPGQGVALVAVAVS